MDRYLSPKQIARALNVSESSVKRWCDQEVIPTLKTAGGHRRIALEDFLRFLRESDRQLHSPESIGLPPYTGKGERILANAKDEMRAGLEAGDEQRCRRVVLNLYLGEHTLGEICDRVIADAFHEIGYRWQCGEVETYQERRGCEICTRVILELINVVDHTTPVSPVAIGASPAGDHYALPTLMVEAVLRGLGFRATSLGTSLPFSTLAAAVRDHRPKIFWLSVSHVENAQQFLEEYREFFEQTDHNTAIVVGGRALLRELRAEMNYSSYCDNLQQLETFARTLQPALQTVAPQA